MECGVVRCCAVLRLTPHSCNSQIDNEMRGFCAVCGRKCKLCCFQTKEKVPLGGRLMST